MIRKLVLFLAALGAFWLFVAFHAVNAVTEARSTHAYVTAGE